MYRLKVYVCVIEMYLSDKLLHINVQQLIDKVKSEFVSILIHTLNMKIWFEVTYNLRYDLINMFNDTSWNLDDINTIDNLEFENHIPDIYSANLQLNKPNTSDKDKKEEIWPSPMTNPIHQQKCQKDKVTTQTTPQKSSIKQQLRTDLGRSVGVTIATQLVWLTWFTGPPSQSPQQPCNQKDKHLKICK